MPGRSRRVASALVVLALVLAAGKWGATFLADRLWEATVSDAVARAGAQRAIAAAGLELLVAAVTSGWLLLHFVLAARIALPLHRPPEVEDARPWPRAIPRWSIPVAALVLGVLLGSGGGGSLDHLRLTLDGAHLGVRDPLVDEDLGVFLGSFPFWSGLQLRATVLSLVASGGVVLLYLAGGTIRLVGHRIHVSRRGRGQLAVLLAVLALCLAWDASLIPMRLAAGTRGPILHSEFVLRSLMSYLETGFGAAAAVMTLSWWFRVRGAVAFLFWMMFVLARIGGALLPLHTGGAPADQAWRATARGLDSIAFQLSGLDRTAPTRPTPAALLIPTLWDDSVATRALGAGAGVHRGWIMTTAPQAVWLGILERSEGGGPAVVAISDDQVASTGAPLSWDRQAGAAVPGLRPFWELPSPLASRPGARRVEIASPAQAASVGVSIDGWADRVVFAWAWQAQGALAAPLGSRVGWRLDPVVRLRAVAPFAHWCAPRLRVLDSRLVWQSDGLLVSDRFPSSNRIPWASSGGSASLVRSGFLGLVDAATGAVRIFRRDPADSFSAVWARIAAPLIEPAASIPGALRIGEAYPEELALAQARVLAGPAWSAGALDSAAGGGGLPPESPGGGERLVPFLRPGTQALASLLILRRTATGDSLRMLRFDTLVPIEPASVLKQRWERFPFVQMLRDSVRAAGALFERGAVRYALAEEGIVAYQPDWSGTPGSRPRLALVNVALGQRLGTGRTFADAWKNLRGEISPTPVGSGAQAVLDEVRRWWLHADSALKRGDLAELGRALAYLRELLEKQ